MALRIEISKINKYGLLKYREGDVDGSVEMYNATKIEVMKEISDKIDELLKGK